MSGYQLCAKDFVGELEATYCERRSADEAMQVCLKEFPLEEGYREHSVVRTEVGDVVEQP